MDRRATHLIALLVAAAIVAVAAPIAQGGNRNHQAPMPDPVRAAYSAAWQAYRGLPGGPSALTVPDPRRAYTAAWQAYRGLPGGPASTRSGYPQPATGLAAAQGFSYAAPTGTANGSGDFDWSDWAIGIGTGLGLALILGGGLLMGRQLRHRGIQTA